MSPIWQPTNGLRAPACEAAAKLTRLSPETLARPKWMVGLNKQMDDRIKRECAGVNRILHPREVASEEALLYINPHAPKVALALKCDRQSRSPAKSVIN